MITWNILFNAKKPGELDDILAGIGSIQVEALTYIRGRSIPDQFIIIDEAQNLTRHEVKTLLTRVGEGSKIVLMGDPNRSIIHIWRSMNNGLAYVVERFKDQKISGNVKLLKGERSGSQGLQQTAVIKKSGFISVLLLAHRPGRLQKPKTGP